MSFRKRHSFIFADTRLSVTCLGRKIFGAGAVLGAAWPWSLAVGFGDGAGLVVARVDGVRLVVACADGVRREAGSG